MNDYEDRVLVAEKRRDEAFEKIEKLEMLCTDKDEAISALREKITRLRDDRANLIALDEERMTTIKEWVRTKFTDIMNDMEAVKRERDELRKMYNRGESLRTSQTSISSKTTHYYEDVFGELLDELQDSSERYETVGKFKDYPKNFTSATSIDTDAPPAIPPRRTSIRKTTHPRILPRNRNASNSSLLSTATEMPRNMFDLPEEPKESPSPFSSHNGSMSSATSKSSPTRERSASHDLQQHHHPLYYQLSVSEPAEYDKDTSAPVYSTLKGIAAQIRDTPFSGDTTDSEAETEEELRTANNLPVRDFYGLPNSHDSSSTPEPALKTCAPYTAQNMNAETLEKAGYLTKLGGRVKNWKRRWFVLHEGKLNYFKNKGTMYGKPLGTIQLRLISQISRSERPNTFEILTPHRTYYLTASSVEEVNEWLRVLRNTMRRINGVQLLPKTGEKTVHSGWVTKAKCGVSKHCWAVLKEKSILFYKSDFEQVPMSCMPLREFTSISIVDGSTTTTPTPSSDAEHHNDDGSVRLKITCLNASQPTYLLIASKSEMEWWLKHLQNLCGYKNPDTATEFELIVSKLWDIDGDLASKYWRNKIMIHSKQLLKKPLSSLSNIDMVNEAINLGKSIRLFSTSLINDTAIEYHVALAQDIIHLCLEFPELQTEIYCQLIKKTSKYRSRPDGENYFLSNDWLTDDTGIDQTIDMNPVGAFVYIQCWQLLCLCASVFLPKLKILWLLKKHLARHANENSDIGRYAIYCERCIERVMKNGEREARTSKLEAGTLLQRNPFYRVFPLSIRVDFINNSYQIFSFDPSTTIAEFNTRINGEIGLRDNSESGFALYTDNPTAQTEHCMQGNAKLCDIISKWERAAQQHRNGRYERLSTTKLTYKCRLFIKSLQKSMTEKERLLHVYQIFHCLKMGHLLPSQHVLTHLTALYSQIHYGDYANHGKSLEDILNKKYPYYTSMTDINNKKDIKSDVGEFWGKLQYRSINDCVERYIAYSCKMQYYGCSFFKAQEKLSQQNEKENQTNVWIAIDEEKLYILSRDMKERCCYTWSKVVTFGGFKEDFMLVVQPDPDNTEKTTRHLFAMPPGRVMEVTFLIASYINAVVARCGLSLNVKDQFFQRMQSVGNTNSFIYLWDMESSST